MQTLFLAIVLSQPPAVPSSPPEVPCGPPAVPQEILPLPSKKRATEGKYVLFVGVEEHPIGMYQTARDDDAYDRPGIYFTDGVQWHRVVSGDPLTAIRLLEREASPLAIPFVKSGLLDRLRARREDENMPAGPWAPNVEWFVGLEKYAPAKNTQSLSRIGSFSYRDSRIAVASRTQLKAKWQVPGGMEGITGWRSDLYRFVPSRKQWVGMIAVFNGSNDQFEQGHKREYADGTQFHDVLSHRGRVFEHRIAEKRDGRWERFVAFKDASARPVGYHGLQQSCASCHSEAGTGGYGTGLVPGGDSVISDPLDGIG